MSNVPAYVSLDLFVLLRYATALYNFFFYIHADELREDLILDEITSRWM
jgi:hypothetical protein